MRMPRIAAPAGYMTSRRRPRGRRAREHGDLGEIERSHWLGHHGRDVVALYAFDHPVGDSSDSRYFFAAAAGLGWGSGLPASSVGVKLNAPSS